jgi:predicted ATPase
METTGTLSRYRSVKFAIFLAFKSFLLPIRSFNVLVGPNNSGKSTAITAFRILAAAMRRADARKPEVVNGPLGQTFGHKIDLSGMSVSDENIFYNYDEDEPASVEFKISNGNTLLLYFPEQGSALSYLMLKEKLVTVPANSKDSLTVQSGSFPYLGRWITMRFYTRKRQLA